ncbi:MAG: ABC transporter substrate-binding protein [Candidatus Aminicenantales bacterium]
MNKGCLSLLRKIAAARTLVAAIFFSVAVFSWAGRPVQKRILRDTLGRSVVIPPRAERVLSLQPEITRILIALGAGERLVGLDYFIKQNDHLFKIIFPEGARLPVVSQPDESVNKELVVRLDPDIIFSSPAEQQVPDSIERSLGIPVAAIASMGRFDKLLEEIQLVGALTGLEGRAEELVRYFRRKIQFISDSIGDLPPEARPSVYLAFWSSLLRTPVFYEPVNMAGGRNVAENLLPSYSGAIGTIINIEQILKWDPEMILIHGNYLPRERQVTVEGVSGDKRLRSVRAVRSKKVHYTFGFWYWWDPAGVLAETIYLAKLFHPEKFRSLDLEKEGNAIFEKFYRKENVFSTLLRTLDFNDWTIP